MKRIVFVCLFTILIFHSYSQSVVLKVGYTNSSSKYVGDTLTFIGDLIKKRHVVNYGAQFIFPFSKSIGISTGLNFIGKGHRYKGVTTFMGVDVISDSKVELSYLELPMTAIFKLKFGSFSPFLFGGGFAATALNGTLTDRLGVTSIPERDILFGNDEANDDMKKIDYGLIGGAGVEFKKVRIEFSYSHGLRDLASMQNTGFDFKTRAYNISLGYRFELSN